MARDNDRNLFIVASDTAVDPDVKVGRFTCERPIKVVAVKLVGGNPADADGDTLALDVSHSSDGFSSSDVEIAALAADEYNDTDDDFSLGTRTAFDVPLTTAALDADGETVRVPGGNVVEVTITWTGAPADGQVTAIVEYITL